MARYTGHTCTIKVSGQSIVAQVLSISGPGISRDTIDTTDADATADWRTFAASYVDGGEVTVEINLDLDNATHDDTAASGLLGGFANDPRTYVVVFPSSETWTFVGIVTGYEPSNPHDGNSTASVTIKVAAQIAFT